MRKIISAVVVSIFILAVGFGIGAWTVWNIYAAPARANAERLFGELDGARRDIERAGSDLRRVGGLLGEAQAIGDRVAIEAGRIASASQRGIYLVGRLREILGIVKRGLEVAVPVPAP
jgi:hypothetical protein